MEPIHIVIEGIAGCGKSVCINRLKQCCVNRQQVFFYDVNPGWLACPFESEQWFTYLHSCYHGLKDYVVRVYPEVKVIISEYCENTNGLYNNKYYNYFDYVNDKVDVCYYLTTPLKECVANQMRRGREYEKELIMDADIGVKYYKRVYNEYENNLNNYFTCPIVRCTQKQAFDDIKAKAAAILKMVAFDGEFGEVNKAELWRLPPHWQ